MNKKKLSICIPTFNRAEFLQECLQQITKQFSGISDVYKVVEIIISDNDSRDKTRMTALKYQSRFNNIKYFKCVETISADKNVLMAASYAKGEYIWFFSDDDIQYPNAIEQVLKILYKNSPDVAILNLNLCSKNGKKILAKNLLNISNNIFLRTKKDFFKHLEKKFMLPIDWYITCLSNTVVSKKLFNKNEKKVLKFYTSSHNNFLHSGLHLYSSADYSVYIVANPLLKFRSDNRSFGPDEKKNKVQYLSYINQIFSNHNRLIYKINKKNISVKFGLLLFLKDTARKVRIYILRLLKIDIISPTSSF